MGGLGTEGVKNNAAIVNGTKIQEELITNWHYGIVLSNSRTVIDGPLNHGCPLYIELANKYSNVSLDITTLWTQLSPKKAGYTFKRAAILEKNLDNSLYYFPDSTDKKNKLIKLTLPDSIIQIDGYTQKYYLENILKYLKRPINRINENGEEPPAVSILKILKKDTVIIKLKSEMGIVSWEEFMSIKKLHLRNTYSSSFMKEIPELKNTKFNFYAIEGGPIDRYEWTVMKKIMTPTNGIYYSTPDFYPRWPKNWKDWQGPWHGWKWIETGRTKEIKDGDYLFSPFVAAGWSKKQEEDIRPAQWLGLLKCLSGIGAEFYYTGYFSLSAPFTDPAKWVWQAAMPAYAQAITSRFEDVLKDGNVLFDERKNPIITYKTNDKHILVTIRKHNEKEKYIICGTYQPFSNEANDIPEKKNVTISFANQELTFEVRRQGSVYVYEKTTEGKTLFYQLDTWHENAHPDYWTKDFCFEAEVADTLLPNKQLFTINEKAADDYTNYTTHLSLSKNMIVPYRFTQRDDSNADKYLWIKYKGEGEIALTINSKANTQNEKLPNNKNWKWHRIKFKTPYSQGNNTLLLQLKTGGIDIDKFTITEKDKIIF
jgi:hypothetical protein